MLALLKRAQPILLALYVVSLCTSMSGMELFSSLLIVSLVLEFIILRPPFKTWQTPPLSKSLVAFAAIILLGILWGDATVKEKLYDAQRIRFFFIYGFLYFLMSRRTDSPVESQSWFKALWGTCIFIAVYGSFQHFMPLDLFRPEGKKVFLYAIQDEKIGPLVVGTFNHHLTFSNVFLLYACVLSALGLGFWPQKSYLLVLGLWISLLCIWTDSRAAWVALPFCAFVVGAVRGPKFMLLTTTLTLIVLSFFYVTDRGFNERFKRTLIQQEDLYSLGPRTRLWKAQWEMFKEHPVLGVGFNNNERKAKEYVDRLYPDRKDNFYGHAHSNTLQLLASTGILGFSCFLLIWCQLFVSLVRYIRATPAGSKKALAIGILAAFVGFHIQGITQWNFGDAEVLHNMMFLWAVAASLSFSKKNGSKKIIAI